MHVINKFELAYVWSGEPDLIHNLFWIYVATHM